MEIFEIPVSVTVAEVNPLVFRLQTWSSGEEKYKQNLKLDTF